MKSKEIQEPKEINLQLENKKKVQKLKEKGITLIALVVTIIILLILAGVTLNMALSGDGLFSKARNAAEKYKKAQEDETKLISEIGKEMNSEYVGAYVEGYTPTNGTYKITGDQSGAEEDQTFTTTAESELRWKKWDYDGTTLRIILDRSTQQMLKLKGVAGYNNGVYIINEICRQCFGQYEGNDDNKKMKEGISVANLRRSDIEKVSNYDYTRYKKDLNGWIEIKDDRENEKVVHYGETRNYTDNFVSPTMWGKHDSKWNYRYEEKNKYEDPSTEIPWEQEFVDDKEMDNSTMTSYNEFRQSYYFHKYDKSEFKNPEYYEMIFDVDGNKSRKCLYWLACRIACLYGEKCDFGMAGIELSSGSYVMGGAATRTSKVDGDCVCEYSLRPIISINLKACGYNLLKENDDNGIQYRLVKN